MSKLNFTEHNVIKVHGDTSIDWQEIELNAPIGLIEKDDKLIAVPYREGSVFVGILANVIRVGFTEIYISPVKLGFVYNVRIEGVVTIGDSLSPKSNGFFIKDNELGMLSVIKIDNDIATVAGTSTPNNKVKNYNDLINKPEIDNIKLIGNLELNGDGENTNPDKYASTLELDNILKNYKKNETIKTYYGSGTKSPFTLTNTNEDNPTNINIELDRGESESFDFEVKALNKFEFTTVESFIVLSANSPKRVRISIELYHNGVLAGLGESEPKLSDVKTKYSVGIKVTENKIIDINDKLKFAVKITNVKSSDDESYILYIGNSDSPTCFNIKSTRDDVIDNLVFDSDTNILTASTSKGNDFVADLSSLKPTVETDNVINNLVFDSDTNILTASTSKGNDFVADLSSLKPTVETDNVINNLVFDGATGNLTASTLKGDDFTVDLSSLKPDESTSAGIVYKDKVSVKTNDTWLDGKPIYITTIANPTPTFDPTVGPIINLVSYKIDTMIDYSVFLITDRGEFINLAIDLEYPSNELVYFKTAYYQNASKSVIMLIKESLDATAKNLIIKHTIKAT